METQTASQPTTTKIDVAPGGFEAAVVEESRRRPVVVDFWAPWCGPCRTLGPVLERLAAQGGGGWLLAKVNVDQDPDVAGRFGVQGIPAVKAFRGGEVVDEFVGAVPEAQVREFLERIVPGPADEAFAAAQALFAAGPSPAARAALERVLALKPAHGPALLALAELDVQEGRPADALPRLDRIPPADEDALAGRIAAVRLRASARPGEDLGALRRKVEAAPADPEARLSLARALAAEGQHQPALEELLEVVRRFHRADPGEEARRTMLQLFEVVGARSELADAYRTRLSRELYR
jgi:putative thioredoxin